MNYLCKVDFDEWAVCGRFVVKPHVDSTLDDSKNLHLITGTVSSSLI